MEERVEERILAAARRGDSDALAELYDRYANSLYGLAFRLTDSASDAQDIVHDVFVGLPEALRSFEGRGRFENWLRSLTLRRCLTELRTRRIRAEIPLSIISQRSAHAGLDPATRITLGRALARLPERTRAVVVLKEVLGLSHKEIGQLLGIKPEASADIMYRARVSLRRTLRER